MAARFDATRLFGVLLTLICCFMVGADAQALPSLVAPPSPLPAAPALQLERVRLPPGFTIALYVDSVVPNARFMALGQSDANATVVFVSSTAAGLVTALVDRGGGSVTACVLLNRGLNIPNGIAYDAQEAALYIASVDRITRHEGAVAAALAGCDASLLKSSVVSADPAALPPQASHGNRALAIGPADGKLYYTVAAPFNVGVCKGTPYCTIHRMDKSGGSVEVFASGIRNAGGMAWHPKTGDLLFAGNERDKMGDNRPDDILAAVSLQGARPDFGFPYCHWQGAGPPEQRLPGPGQAISDANLAFNSSVEGELSAAQQAQQAATCAATMPKPIQALGPHVAPLGVLYWPAPGSAAGGAGNRTVQRWPAEYDGSVFTGQHGSWNRDPPIGYRVLVTKLSSDGRTSTNNTVFAEGWLDPSLASGQPSPHPPAWGRPVGLLRLPDGSMLVADDFAQVVYRISYDPNAAAPKSAGAAAGPAQLLVLAAAAAAVALLAL